MHFCARAARLVVFVVRSKGTEVWIHRLRADSVSQWPCWGRVEVAICEWVVVVMRSSETLWSLGVWGLICGLDWPILLSVEREPAEHALHEHLVLAYLIGACSAEHLVGPRQMGWLDLGQLEDASQSQRVIQPESAQSSDSGLDLGAGVVLDFKFSEVGNDEEVLGVLAFLGLGVVLLLLALRDEEAVVVTPEPEHADVLVHLEMEMGGERVRDVGPLVGPEERHGVGHF